MISVESRGSVDLRAVASERHRPVIDRRPHLSRNAASTARYEQRRNDVIEQQMVNIRGRRDLRHFDRRRVVAEDVAHDLRDVRAPRFAPPLCRECRPVPATTLRARADRRCARTVRDSPTSRCRPRSPPNVRRIRTCSRPRATPDRDARENAVTVRPSADHTTGPTPGGGRHRTVARRRRAPPGGITVRAVMRECDSRHRVCTRR